MESNIVLVVAGLAAGALNAVAGGGTFLSFPALVWIGVPPIMANATATLAALPGYVGGAWGFRRDIRTSGPISLAWTIAMAALGGLLGALLLLVTPKETFSTLVPWLLLAIIARAYILPEMVQARARERAARLRAERQAREALRLRGLRRSPFQRAYAALLHLLSRRKRHLSGRARLAGNGSMGQGTRPMSRRLFRSSGNGRPTL